MNFDSLTPTQKRKAIKRLHKDHRFLAEEIFGIKENDLLPFQHDIIESIFQNKKTAVQACHDTGKTFSAALGGVIFFHSHKNTTIVSTAPTTNLLQNQLWAEFRAHHKRAKYPLGSRILEGKPEMRIDEKWFAIGFVPQKDVSDAQSDFQGFHNDWILVIFDEATGIPKKIWDMAESMMTSANVRFLALGNPTDPSGQFAKVCKLSSWHQIKISCFDIPNIYENGIRNMADLRKELSRLQGMKKAERRARVDRYKTPWPNLLTLEWVLDKLEDWGEDSPYFQSRVLGIFPLVSDDTLISPAAIQEACDRDDPEDDDDWEYIGIDVARFGKDKTIIKSIKYLQERTIKTLQKKDTEHVAGWVINYCTDQPGRIKIGIDDTGVGGGVTDKLKNEITQRGDLRNRVIVVPINFGCKSTDPIKYVNLKAEIFCILKDDIEGSLKLSGCDITNSQLGSIKYKLTAKGQKQIESKEDMKKRGLPSPDEADALGISNYMRHQIGNEPPATAPVSMTKASAFAKV